MKKKNRTQIEKLDNIQTELKKEFVGIDSQIEQIIAKMKNWYLYPQFQEQPLIICLWGMTGVGKTSLLKRFMELLQLHESYFKFDMGERDFFYHTKSNFEDIDKMAKIDKRVAICFDEFQLARTVNAKGEEAYTTTTNRILWEILDTGMFSYSDNAEELYELQRRLNGLKELLRMGVQVENGLVVAGKDIFEDYLLSREKVTRTYFPDSRKDKVAFDYDFIQEDDWSDIVKKTDNEKINSHTIQEKLKTMNGSECINYFTKLIKELRKPKVVDCRKTLIFICGNLDEAYSMYGDMDADIDADVIHEYTRHINPSHILQALSKRFRVEQIARLGTNHIIYPALSKNNFEQFIKMQSERFKMWVSKKFGYKLKIAQSVLDYIYSEGVNPVLGIRPLKNVIYNHLNIHLPSIAQLYDNHENVESIEISISGNQLVLEARNANKKTLGVESHELLPYTLMLRRNTTDDELANTCVHEAGHIVAHIEEYNRFPVSAGSLSRNSASTGFVLGEQIPLYTKAILEKKVAVSLAGHAAEEIIFGRDNICAGSSSDIIEATRTATNYFKKYGFGDTLGAYFVEDIKTNDKLFDTTNALNTAAQNLIKKMHQEVVDILTNNQDLLMAYARALFSNYKLNQEEMISIYKSVRPLENNLISNSYNYHEIMMAAQSKSVRQLLEMN